MDPVARLSAIELRHLRHALALAAHGSFARAAEACHITQPALTKSIQVLEALVGTPVFTRTRAGVEPTEAGQHVLRYALQVDDASRDLGRELFSANGIEDDSLTLATGTFHTSRLVGPVVASLLKRAPGLRVRVFATPLMSHPFRTLAREVDLVVAERGDLEEDPHFETVALEEHRVIVYARSGHPLAARLGLGLADLAPYPFALAMMRPTTMERAATNAIARMRVALRSGALRQIECESALMAHEIIHASDALGLGNRFLIERELSSGQFAVLRCEDLGVRIHYAVGWVAGRPLSPVATRFVAMLKAHARHVSEQELAVPE